MCSLNTWLGSLSPKSWFVQLLVVLVRVVDALEEVRDPTDAALGQGDTQVRELAQHRRPQQVGGAQHDVHRLQGDHACRSARPTTVMTSGRRRTDVQAHDRAGLDARLPERVPVVAVEAGEAELLGVLREGDGVAALGSGAADLGGHELGDPRAAGWSAGSSAPGRCRTSPRCASRCRPAAARGRWPCRRWWRRAGRQKPVRLGKLSEPSTPLTFMSRMRSWMSKQPGRISSKAGGVEAPLLGHAAGDRVEPDVGHGVALEHPDVSAVVEALHEGRPFGGLGRQPPLEQVRRFDDVVVDADEDQVFCLHLLAPQGSLYDRSVRLVRPRRGASRARHFPRRGADDRRV